MASLRHLAALLGLAVYSYAQPPVGTYSPGGQPTLGPSDSGSLLGPASLAGVFPNAISTADSAFVTNAQLIPAQSASADLGFYLDFKTVARPEPIRGDTGATDPGPDTSRYDRYNSDKFASPDTDSGSVPNSQWPIGLSHNRLLNGGWARQQNIQNLPVATDMAGVDMRLKPFAYREMHWHTAGEWAYVFKGSARIAVVNSNGENYIDDVGEGDVWFFPSGIPHSIQALDQGVEFLLIFDNGSFSEDSTSLVSEMFLRNPRAVLAKNFQAAVSDFDDIPPKQLYIFPGTNPGTIDQQNLTGPAGAVTDPSKAYTYHWSKAAPVEVPNAGTVKFLEPADFPIANDFSVALLTIKPGAMRELHWHIDTDEWNFFLQGQARITIYDAPTSGRTFDYGAGDIGYIQATNAHYIENTGDEDVILLEVLQAPQFTDISVAQWLGLTPKQVVKETMNLPDSVIDNLPKYKPILIPGNVNMTATNFTAPFGP